MTKFVNLTPHAITLRRSDSPVGEAFPASGTVARCAVEKVQIGEIDGTPVYRSLFGDVVGLPEPVEGTVYIVSQLVAQAARNRSDLVFPDSLVRDEDGRIIGCTAWGQM